MKHVGILKHFVTNKVVKMKMLWFGLWLLVCM